MVFDFLNWNNRREIAVFSVIACSAIVWLQESMKIEPLFFLRAIAGFYLAVFPVGFLFLLIIFNSKSEMAKIEWFVYSIALSIAFFSLLSVFANVALAQQNDVWTNLRVVLFSSVFFYLAGKARSLFGW